MATHRRVKLAGVRVSIWLVLMVLVGVVAMLTWRYLALPASLGETPSIFEVFGWLFWMVVLAVAAIWVCWVKTNAGWRWRWDRF